MTDEAIKNIKGYNYDRNIKRTIREQIPQNIKITPMLEQYIHWKERYPDYLLMFRMGDFFEMFFDDAFTASEVLDIALTARDQDRQVPMSGVPYHAIENYLARLVEAGYRAALCDQITKPDGKNLVEREVVRIVTPGTFVPLEGAQEGRLAACCANADGTLSAAFISMATGRFEAGVFAQHEARSLIASFCPQELIVPKNNAPLGLKEFEDAGCAVIKREADMFSLHSAAAQLKRRFGLATLEGLGFYGLDAALGAAGAALRYVDETQFGSAGHISAPKKINTHSGLLLDASSLRNLELTDTGSQSLYGVLNRTNGAMGKRKLRSWIIGPLNDLDKISARHDAVEKFINAPQIYLRTKNLLAGLPDGQRALSRLNMKTSSPKDMAMLRDALNIIAKLDFLSHEEALSPWIISPSQELVSLIDILNKSIADNPPRNVNDFGIIKSGFDNNLDELRGIKDDGDGWLKAYQEKEKIRSGIKGLKVGYNRVFGYYIEISRASSDTVPEDYIRRQTLSGNERFVTEELKIFENKRMSADIEIQALEERLYGELLSLALASTEEIKIFMDNIAELDVLISFADSAKAGHYTRPVMSDDGIMEIKGGRHPVVEAVLGSVPFTPNDMMLDDGGCRIVLLTGPNMAGKSTYLRMGALIVIMAHMGSFVPADAARICRTDRLFTRIGARDDTARGQSTFMVEMVETAQILNGLCPRSLVILDEIGRGTSTDDGMSIAWAIMEYLQNDAQNRPKVLFATHYHELTALNLPGVKNYSVAVEETKNGLIFLHSVVPRPAGRSYGVDVARLAGLPKAVLNRSVELLARFERRRKSDTGIETILEKSEKTRKSEKIFQTSIFGPDVEYLALADELSRMEPENMTPMQALEAIFNFKQRALNIKENKLK